MGGAPFPLIIEEQGAGAPLILLHGMASDRRTWDGVAPLLARGRRVIRYDLRGFGQSPHPNECYSHTDDLRLLLEALGLQAWDLAGVSWGDRWRCTSLWSIRRVSGA
jgi:3-oxoadipate enol-lactonase